MPVEKITIGDGITAKERWAAIETPDEDVGEFIRSMFDNAKLTEGGRQLWARALDFATELNGGAPPKKRGFTRSPCKRGDTGPQQTKRWYAEESTAWATSLKYSYWRALCRHQGMQPPDDPDFNPMSLDEFTEFHGAVIAAEEISRLMAEARIKFEYEKPALTGKKFHDKGQVAADHAKARAEQRRKERAALFGQFIDQGYSRMNAARKSADQLGCSVKTIQRAVKKIAPE